MKLFYRIGRRFRRWVNQDIYRKMYEAHAALTCGREAVGGSYNRIGQIEFDLLRIEGLSPDHTLLDLGCGNGRLAIHVVPYLVGGIYVGVDISQRLLAEAKTNVATNGRPGGCRVEWRMQTSCRLAQPTASVDMICAFSVFTHIEHEDSYQYLREARRVIRPSGKLVFSCLPLELPAAREIFRTQAAAEFNVRWAAVRNVATSRDMMTELARMSGWRVERWYAGNEQNIPGRDGEASALGQSSCVLRPDHVPQEDAEPLSGPAG